MPTITSIIRDELPSPEEARAEEVTRFVGEALLSENERWTGECVVEFDEYWAVEQFIRGYLAGLAMGATVIYEATLHG